ncbi:MAG: hypothetical protein H5T33_06445 [Candidatus Methanosuratus sp.]|nr:hypothetical protein [Candidatus Methanosuratincola sp.]
MKRSIALALINSLIVVFVIAAFGIAFLVAANAFGAAYSIRTGEPLFNSSGPVVQFSVPVSLSNPGPLAVSDISLTATVRGMDGETIAVAPSAPVSVPPGAEDMRFEIPLIINLSEIPGQSLSLLFQESGNLSVEVDAEAGIAPFVRITASVSAEVPWSPPVQDLQIGDPAFLGYNSTHLSASIPVSFRNTGEFVVDGSMNVTILDAETGAPAGAGALGIYAPPQSDFSGDLVFAVRLPENATALLFEDMTFRYNFTLGFDLYGIEVFSETEPVDIEWGALVSNPYLGSPAVSPHNLTFASLAFPIGFENANDFVTLDGSVTVALVINDQTVAESSPVYIHAPPDSSVSTEVVLQVPKWALVASGNLVVTLSTGLWSASLEVPYNHG